MTNRSGFSLVLLALLFGSSNSDVLINATGSAGAAEFAICPHCQKSCKSCQLVERTVMVPMEITEKRYTTCVVKVPEEREETYTVFQRVPETVKYTKEKCYLAHEVRSKMITEKQCQIVNTDKIVNYMVKVPEKQIIEETKTRSICTDKGKVCVEETCPREVTVERLESRTKTCEVPQVVTKTTKREINYCVQVPKKEVIPCREETIYRLVPVEKTRTVTVCVPKVTKKPIYTTVCKMVPKTVVCCESCSHSHK